MTEHRLRTPLSMEDIKKLRSGDVVFLSGPIYTARDKAHALLRTGESPVSLEGAALYHCGPLIRGDEVLSAGPTTSGRMARYTEEILRLGVKAIIGKGGLPAEPFLGRAVYLAYPGGCGAAAAQQLRFRSIRLQELGMAEAMWEFDAENLGPMIVAVDSHGGDLYRDVRRSVQSLLRC
ncbi:MAG TPA: fumarate hydratase C-terminal domain-containing protein [Methanothrix sp.]|nr:fumarate hydratase C-terminal domain-containing protein [Methanothrix sp.]